MPGEDVERRRGDRIFVLLPIVVTATEARGGAFQEETTTVSINRHGGCITLSHSLLPADAMLIRNLWNGMEERFRVIGVPQEIFGAKREYGVETLSPGPGIWGVEFTPPSVEPKIFIQCAECKKEAVRPVFSPEYQVLLHTGLISQHCEHCDQVTRWRPSEQTLTAEVAVGPGEVLPAKEQRKHRRLDLTMRLAVRSSTGREEIVQTLDVSKSGLCFVGRQLYKVHEEIFLLLPFDRNRTPVATRGRIIWSREGRGGRLYGISLGP